MTEPTHDTGEHRQTVQEHPAAPLRHQLESALDEARFTARVDVTDDRAALNLTVLSSDKTPFDRTAQSAQAWLADSGIGGTAAFNDACDIVIGLPTAASVHQLTAVLLDPHIRAQTTATQLDELLNLHCLIGSIEVHGADAIQLMLPDSDCLGTVVRFGALLGAPGIDDGLELHRPRGMRRLADRVQWLATGVAGSPIRAVATPGCVHAEDQVTLRFSIDQARRLTQRLASHLQDPKP